MDYTDLFFVTLMVTTPVVSAWLIVLCFTKGYRSKQPYIVKSISVGCACTRESFSFCKVCSKLCHFLLYPYGLRKLNKGIDRGEVITKCDIPPSLTTDTTGQLFHEKWPSKSVSTTNSNAVGLSQTTNRMLHPIRRTNSLSQSSDRLSSMAQTSLGFDSRKFNQTGCGLRPRKAECVVHIGKVNHRKKKNYLLVKKYKRYIMNIRGISSAGSGDLVILNSQTMKTSNANRTSQKNAIPDNSLALESPWVRSEKAKDEKSGVSWRTNSSSSSVRARIALKISPKARDPNDIIEDLYILPERVILDRPTLEGTFGKIFEARLRIPADRRRSRPDCWSRVLVKTVTGQAKAEQIRVFMTDAAKLAGIQHKQIASVLASTRLSPSSFTRDEALENIPVLIYPHYKYGNLKTFLRKTVSGGSDEHSTVVSLTLGLRFNVVLSDSALSRDLFPEDYHCLGDNTNRPIKWLAIEALVERKFSTATDIWSFGITMWELITKGQQPYDMFDPFEMPNVLCAGYRLRQPLNCPDSLWNIIQACWRIPPASRPTVDRLKRKLNAFKKTIDGFI
ncbi:Tyrosine-protein kinase Dnt [Fasciola gigantica]|uniref:Tyrosine-protein kinase Dnt n=1 Tax=Fasciola gigantica TaxID=46835 RepID=A0A504Z030_FASGI|nr:Tyrosine-protein kinase Dnt [Fasciola gigantica]